MVLKAHITGNTIYVLSSGAKSHSVWLSSDLVNFAQSVSIHIRGTQKFRGMVKPSIETILEDYRLRADRQVLYTARVDVN